METEPSRTARKSSLDSGLQCRTTMRRCPRRKVDNAAKVFYLRKTRIKEEKEEEKRKQEKGGKEKLKRRGGKVDLWNLCFRQPVLFLKEPWEKASHLGEQGLQDSENVYLLSLCLSFARSLDSALDLKGCSCEGGKKKKGEKKKEKGTKRERRGKRERRRTSNASFINVARAGFVSGENRVRNAWKSS